MPDELTRAAESLAPSRPTTQFFGERNPVAGAAGARSVHAATREAADSVSRLTTSRWDRVARRRQQEMWGREDEDYADKKNFDAQRGEFLRSIAGIDPTADDYLERKSELIATLPKGALRDDAVKSIFASMDRVYGDARRERDSIERDERYMNRWEAQEDARVRKQAAEYLSPEEMVGYDNRDDLLYAAMQRKREMEAAEGGLTPSETRIRAKEADAAKLGRVERLLGDDTAFPSRVEMARRTWADGLKRDKEGKPARSDTTRAGFKAADSKSFEAAEAADKALDTNAYLAQASRVSRDDYIAQVGEGADEQTKKRRGELWDLAQEIMGGAETPAAEEPPTAEIPEGTPTKTLSNGQTAYWVDGKWQLKD